MVCCLFVTIYCHATGLGPLLLAICVFIYMQMEIETKMLGVLGALGVRESVYWVSWWIPFLMISFVNAILGAITAKIIENVHVWAATSFGPIFVSLFFLNVALVGGSFLLVAVAGGTRALAALFILVMVVAAWIPYAVVSGKSVVLTSPGSVNGGWNNPPNGLFWLNGNTVRPHFSTTSIQYGYTAHGALGLTPCLFLSLLLVICLFFSK